MTPIEVAHRSLETWNADDRAGHRATYADDAVVVEHATHRRMVGADAIVDAHFAWREAFPGMRGEVEDEVASGDGVAYRTTWRGTHAGPLVLPDGRTIPPTGRSVELPASLFVTVRDERVVEQHHYFDMATLAAELGLSPEG